MAAARDKPKREVPRPIYVIFSPPKKTKGSKDPAELGTEEFLRGERLDALKRALLGDGFDPDAVAEFDGPTALLAEVLDACRTPSLFSGLRVVCVHDADRIVNNTGFLKKHRADLEAYLAVFDPDRQKDKKKEKPPPPEPTGVLVLICRSWPKTTRLYKLTERIGRNLSCQPPQGEGAFIRWIEERARTRYDCRIDPEAAACLLGHIGRDLGPLNMELAKLSVYVGSRNEIRVSDIEAVVGVSRLEKVFGITEAIARRAPARALELWHQVLASDRDAPYRAVGGLAYGFRRLAEAKGGTPPFPPIRDLDRQLPRFSLARWRQCLVDLLRIDVGSKTGLGSVESAVEQFIVRLCVSP